MLETVITIIGIALGIFFLLSMPRKRSRGGTVPEGGLVRQVLLQRVTYFSRLQPAEQERFISELQYFIAHVTIHGVRTTLTDDDRILVAASAIIPIFAFPGWRYPNLHEVLLYPDRFSGAFSLEQGDPERNFLGIVGTGALNNVMVLSRPALHHGYADKISPRNTAIHEFVHLIDKTDGAVDGMPNLLTEKNDTMPWQQLMRREMLAIKNSESDMDDYGATNEAEFFAVASEYFFERPILFKHRHRELYDCLAAIYKQHPLTDIDQEIYQPG